MWHLAAYTATFAAPVANSQIAALNDQVLTIRNNDFFLKDAMKLIWAAAMGPTIDNASLSSPSLRIPTFPFITPVNVGAIPVAESRVEDYTRQPFQLYGEEQLQFRATDPAAAPGRITGVVGLQLMQESLPAGNIVKMHGTSTTAVTANVWSSIEPVTYENDLPDGTYALVGMEHISANGQACRTIFFDQVLRPGCVSKTAFGNRASDIFTLGRLGKWGAFANDRVPNLEVLANAADAVHNVYLYLIQL